MKIRAGVHEHFLLGGLGGLLVVEQEGDAGLLEHGGQRSAVGDFRQVDDDEVAALGANHGRLLDLLADVVSGVVHRQLDVDAHFLRIVLGPLFHGGARTVLP